MRKSSILLYVVFLLTSLNLFSLDGKKVYQTYCAACHGAEGVPVSEVFPPLAGSEWIKGDAGRMVEIILGGLVGEITVKGKQYNLLMPTQGASMSDEEVAAVATYVRSSWGHEETPVTADYVKNLRSTVEIGESLEAHKVLAKYPLPASLELKNCVSQVATFQEALSLSKAVITTAVPSGSSHVPHPQNTLIPHVSQYYEGSHRTLHTGDLEIFADGAYTFKLSASEWAEVKLNNEVLLSSTSNAPAEKLMELKAGVYPITVQTYGFSSNKQVLLDILKGGSKAFQIGRTTPPRKVWVTEESPLIYRNILKDSSARGMAIGFPSQVNILIDLESGLLTKIWSGEFIDVNTHFVFRGELPAGAAGEDVLILNAPLKVRDESVDYQGYNLNPAGEPIFNYKIGGQALILFYQGEKGSNEVRRTFAASGDPLQVEIARLKNGIAQVSADSIETKRWKIHSDTGFNTVTEGEETVVYLTVSGTGKSTVKYQLKQK